MAEEQQPLNENRPIHYVDVNVDDVSRDPLVAQLPKAMLKYVRTPREHRAYECLALDAQRIRSMHSLQTVTVCSSRCHLLRAPLRDEQSVLLILLLLVVPNGGGQERRDCADSAFVGA